MIYDFIVLRCGLPIYTMNFDPSRGLSHDQKKFTLISGFFSAISTFVDSVDNIGQVDEIQMSSDLFFSFRRITFTEGDVLFVLSSDQHTAKNHRREIIKEASEEFLSVYLQTLTSQWDGKTESFQDFNNALVKIIQQILSTPGEMSSISNDYNTRIIGPPSPTSGMNYAQENPHLVQAPQYAAATAASGNDRFNRYQTLQFFQQQYQNIDPAMTAAASQQSSMPWADPSAWTTRGLSQTSITRFNRNPTHFTKSESDQSYHTVDQDHTMRVQPAANSRSLTANGYNEMLGQFSNSHRVEMNHEQITRSSIFDLVPYKQNFTAGAFRDGLANDWVKVLFVAVDGRKNIATLAEQLNISPQDVVKGCQFLSQKGLVGI